MPGDKFTGEVLKLRITDILNTSRSLLDYTDKTEIGLDDVPVIREEVNALKNEYRSLKLDIFKYNAAIKEGAEPIDVDEFKTFDSDLREILRKCNSVDPQIVQKALQPVEPSRLPLPLEKFGLFIWDGDIAKWNTWFSLFMNTIDNNSNLNPSQKFLYLKKYLKDEPLAICDQLEITDYNYKQAIYLLKTRYQNERRLGSFYLSQLMNYCKNYSGADLSKFLTVHRSSIAALRNLSEITDLADFCFFHLCYNNLDSRWQNAFDMSRAKNLVVPQVEDLLDFVQFAATNQELKLDSKKEIKREDFKPKSKYNCIKSPNKHFVGITEAKASSSKFSQEKSCPCCLETHKLYLCDKFKGLTPDRRNELVKQWRRCQNCLGTFHNPCPSSLSCYVCKRAHHTLLHQDASSHPAKVISCATSSNKQVLLGTIRCEIKDSFRTFVPARILLDSGAQTSVVSYHFVKTLGLPFKFSAKFLKGLAENKINALGQIELTVRPRQRPMTSLSVTAIVLKQKRLCGDLPTGDVPEKIRTSFQHLDLADPDFIKSSKIDMILGADMLPKILQPGSENIYKDSHGLIAQKTIFGFVISGAVPERPKEPNEMLVSTLNSSLEENLEKFWRNEEVVAPKSESPDDLYCERLFTSTTQRLPDGRFSVRLPFKPGTSPEKLKNCQFAVNSYKNLEKRLAKDDALLDQYKEQIRSYLDLDQMVPSTFGTATYILPQLVVLRKSALTTQIRICFNASTPAFMGFDRPRTSLNDLLLPGPKLQADLNSILIRFRLNTVGLMADVEMMFRRISVSPEDRKFLHIFYRDSPDACLEELEFTVLPFGLRCSPYLAQRTVQELLNLDGHLYPQAASALRKNLYVDDFVGSFPSIEAARLMKVQLTQLMSRGGFTLRKWASSHPEVLEDVPVHNKGKICFDDENRTIKVLGLIWDAMDDCFAYKILEFDSPITERTCLSYIARTFDCLGFVTPVIFWMKLFLQKLWTLDIGWDDPLPDDLVEKWNNFTREMSTLEEIRIPRCILREGAEVFLTGFSDGSQVGYAACIYLVARYSHGYVASHLLTSKSKLAPLATISIPRLELNGALLLSRLCRNTLQALDELDIKNIYLFTDSQIVLAWIRSQPFRLKTYVANRVSKIQLLTANMHWNYVSTLENPSDCASRGLSPAQLLHNSLWWAGPPFLKTHPNPWVSSAEPPVLELPEVKETTILVADCPPQESFFSSVISRCSTFGKLQRVMAYILRYKRNAKVPPTERQLGALQVSELEEALKQCILFAQQEDFPEELKHLKTKQVPPSGRLLKFNPYLDQEGILRVGGRLENSLLTYKEKHPVLLSKTSPLSRLICEHFHKLLLHAGPRTTRAAIQRRFWIISLHSLLRKIIYRCPRCLRWQAKPITPQMGNLPVSRVRPSRCFASTTLDMAGPFTVTEARRRKSPQHKIYVCVFVCEATKAIHIEPVTELSTEAFLAAFHRFASRRSLPHRLRSDNGRNFIGARRHLKECQTFLQEHNEEICSSLSSREVIWELNPAYSPHFGGLHEAAVKSAKLLFYKVVGNTTLTMEEFYTILSRIEAVLNSRPLCFLSSDPNEGVDYLSPGHFLVGGPLVAVPEKPLDLDTSTHNRWELVRQMSQKFWKRYHQEYLHTLMTREKWSKDCTNVHVDQLVYVSGEKTSPLVWPIGRIVNTYPGADGKVRVVDVRMGNAIARRGVHKLVVIPTDEF